MMDRTLYALLVVYLLFTSLVTAQTGATAALRGLLKDPSGAVLGSQVVTLISVPTAALRTAETNAEGVFFFGAVAPGNYELKVEASGFAPHVVRDLSLAVGQEASLEITLGLAVFEQTQTIRAASSLFEPSRTELSQVIGSNAVERLPINGRRFLDFVLLAPNVRPGRTNVGNPATPVEPNQINVSFLGLHETLSLIQVDGANAMNRVFLRPRATPSQEAVQEFRVVTQGYLADSGPSGGGVVNIVTRSGDREFRGAAYNYFRNAALDARNILAPEGFKQLQQNQFGGSFGGPLSERRFFFINFEAQRRRESPPYSSLLLDNLAEINRARQSLNLPPEIVQGKLRIFHYDSAVVRIDDLLTDRTQGNLSYRFRQDRYRNISAATNQLSAPSNFRNARIPDHAAIANLTTAYSASVLNQASFQFAVRSFGFPSATFEPHLQISNTLDMGRHFNAIERARERRFDFSDTLSWTRGRHVIRAGGVVSHTSDTFTYNPFDPGYAIFPNLNAFLGRGFGATPFAVVFGYVAGANGERPPALPGFPGPANLPAFERIVNTANSQANFGLFVSDQWSVNNRLQVNYGVRWDADLLPERYYERYWKAVQPRAGASFRVSDRITLRAGGGFYQGQAYTLVYLIEQVAGQDSTFGAVRANENYAVSSGTLHTPFFANPALATANLLQLTRTGRYPALRPGNFAPAQQFFTTNKRDHRGGPRSYQWNAQTDVRLPGSVALTLAYLGARGLGLPSSFAGNIAPAQARLPNGKNDYAIAPNVPVPRTLNPLVAPLSLFFDAQAQSSYHAGTAVLSQRLGGRLYWSANYTWSKTLDNSSDPSLNGFPEDPYNRALERSVSRQHAAHRLVAVLSAEAGPRGWLRDFRASLVSTAQSANYFTVLAGSDANRDGNTNTDRVGTLGRNTYRGDSLLNLDVRVSRVFRAGERLRVEAIAEMFNLTNTVNVTDLNMVYGSPGFIGAEPRRFGQPVAAPLASFGSIRAVEAPRQAQLALRIQF
ncbi:MAG: TonB-dependent receptor [Bryobacteraceae bacterium]|nr:TonB-dependent receptor [Bryobacteraceae bacterium]